MRVSLSRKVSGRVPLPSPLGDMAVQAITMLEYFTCDQEARHGHRGPWFPPLSSSAEPVSLQLVAISQHDTSRYEPASHHEPAASDEERNEGGVLWP